MENRLQRHPSNWDRIAFLPSGFENEKMVVNNLQWISSNGPMGSCKLDLAICNRYFVGGNWTLEIDEW